jgi:hypothetical protein
MQKKILVSSTAFLRGYSALHGVFKTIDMGAFSCHEEKDRRCRAVPLDNPGQRIDNRLRIQPACAVPCRPDRTAQRAPRCCDDPAGGNTCHYCGRPLSPTVTEKGILQQRRARKSEGFRGFFALRRGPCGFPISIRDRTGWRDSAVKDGQFQTETLPKIRIAANPLGKIAFAGPLVRHLHNSRQLTRLHPAEGISGGANLAFLLIVRAGH